MLALDEYGEDQKLWKSEEEIESERDWDNWILVAVLNCPDEKESRIVLNDWNWA